MVKQAGAKWGDGLIDQLSKYLIAEFPEVKGFSRSNPMYIKNGICSTARQVQLSSSLLDKLRNSLFRNYPQAQSAANPLAQLGNKALPK